MNKVFCRTTDISLFIIQNLLLLTINVICGKLVGLSVCFLSVCYLIFVLSLVRHVRESNLKYECSGRTCLVLLRNSTKTSVVFSMFIMLVHPTITAQFLTTACFSFR